MGQVAGYFRNTTMQTRGKRDESVKFELSAVAVAQPLLKATQIVCDRLKLLMLRVASRKSQNSTLLKQHQQQLESFCFVPLHNFSTVDFGLLASFPLSLEQR